MEEQKQGKAAQPRIEELQQPPKGCERLAATYAALREQPVQGRYTAMLKAMEADVVEGCVAFLPMAKEDLEKLVAGKGQLRWTVVKTPDEKTMLAVFTSPEEAGRQGAAGNVGVPLGVCLQTMMKSKELAGIILNPFDRNGAIVVKDHIRQVLEHIQRKVQRLDQPVVVESVWKLWGEAVGVPGEHRDVREEVAALGGVDGLMGPVMADWKRRFDAGEFKSAKPMELMRNIATDVLRYSLTAAAMAKVSPGFFKGSTPYAWLKDDVVEADGESLEEELWLSLDGDDPAPEKVAELQKNVKLNVDAYFRILGAALKEQGLVKEDAQLGASMLANAGPVCFGLMSFGVGWGTALYEASRG